MKISFRSISMGDIPLMHAWFNRPHVQEFYSLRDWTENDVLDKLKPYIHQEKPLFGFISLLEEEPVGYLQYCYIKENPWPEQDLDETITESAAGLDLFIGDESWIGKGLGPKIVEAFLKTIIWPRFQYCIVDPDLRNRASIRLFEKCGFIKHKTIYTHDTLGNPVELCLMIKNRETDV